MNHLSVLKTIITALLLMGVANSAFTQSVQTEVEIIQEAFGLEKKVAVANFMELGENAESFWKIYDEYEAERKELGTNRIKIIADYAKSYSSISDEEIQVLFKRTQTFKKSFAKLQKSYFNRMRKEVGTSKAAQFFQLESYFNAMIQAEIYTQIPFIGENLNGN
ncbi:MAG: hypothetical protein AAFO07_07630 [Bacteroidota bacterium]